MSDVPHRERVQAEQLVGLSEQHIDRAAAVELRGRLRADIGAAAAFDAIVAGEFVDAERIAIEHHALGVFVGQLAGVGFIGRAMTCAIGSIVVVPQG